MDRECSFNAYAVRNTTNGEHFTNAGAAACNYYTFVHLYAFTSTFDYFYINFYGVACTEVRDVGTKLLLFQYFNNIHNFLLES